MMKNVIKLNTCPSNILSKLYEIDFENKTNVQACGGCIFVEKNMMRWYTGRQRSLHKYGIEFLKHF